MNSSSSASLLRWVLAAIYLGLCFLPLLFVPDWVTILLVPAWFLLALWSFLRQESFWGREKGIRPLTRWDIPDWERFQADIAEAVDRVGLKRQPLWAVLPDDEPNAMAVGTPRGMVVITRGLLQRFPQEEITAVVGHELSHLASRDSLPGQVGGSFLYLLALISWQSREAGRQAGRSIAAFPLHLVSIAIDLFLGTVGWLARVVLARRSRSVEHRADLVGAQLTSAGTMMGVLERLDALGYHDYKAPRWSSAWIAQQLHRSHPPKAERIRFLQEAVERGEVHG